MSSLSPTIPINLLRSASVKPVFRNARRFHASPAPRGRLAPVNVDSLAETLENHRLANNPPVVRKVVSAYSDALDRRAAIRRAALGDGPPSSQRQSIPSQSTSSPSPSRARRRKGDAKIASLKLGGEESSQRSKVSSRTSQRDVEVARRLGNNQGKFDNPWLDLVGDEPAATGLERLDQEIRAFATYMRSIPVEDDAAQKLQQQVSDALVAAGLPRPLLFGSRRTGIALRHSNLNLMIPLEDPDGAVGKHTGRGPSDSRPKIVELQYIYLNNAFYVFQNEPQFSHCRLPSDTRVPRVTTTHLPTGMSVCIQAGVKLPAADDYVMNYVAEYPALPELFAVMRMILETRLIFGRVHHTVTSYGLIMLIVGALKLGEGTFDRKADLGRQLIHVLRFYAHANFRRFGISIEPPALFRKKDPNSVDPITAPAHIRGQISIGKRSAALRSSIVCLQDPANYMHDLGENFFRTLEVQALFRYLINELEAGMLAWDIQNGTESPADSLRDKAELGERPMSLLHSAVGGDYDLIERLRDKTVLALDR